MRNFKFLLAGILFGVALTKGEAMSWYRIAEMFRFEGFHMFGIFMTAIPTGAFSLWLIKKYQVKTADGEVIEMPKKEFQPGVIIGSLIFGFGWALTGACPGPLYVQLGSGFFMVIVAILSALLGTWTFGYVQKYLP
jgi:uncharacterized membrane protein YedE/YeeE